MKNLKRNLVIAVVLLFVCAAVYLNWSYNKKWGTPDGDMVSTQDKNREEAGLSGENDDMSVDANSGEDDASAGTNDYFALARLTRQKSRDEALGLLQMAATSESASQEVIDSAMNEIAVMATWSMREAQLENLLIAKEFTECVVFMSDTDVTVAVPAPPEGLSEAAVARITDAIIGETNFGATQIHIIPVIG